MKAVWDVDTKIYMSKLDGLIDEYVVGPKSGKYRRPAFAEIEQMFAIVRSSGQNIRYPDDRINHLMIKSNRKGAGWDEPGRVDQGHHGAAGPMRISDIGCDL